MRPGAGGDAFVWATPASYVVRSDGTWHPARTPGGARPDPTPAADALGRIWFAPKTGGFGVVGADGTTTSWPGCSALGDVLDFVVVGNGPPLPAALPEAIRGPVRGRLVRKGKPVAGAIVYLASPAILGLPESDACALHRGGDFASA